MAVLVKTLAESWQGQCCERSSSLKWRIIVKQHFFSFEYEGIMQLLYYCVAMYVLWRVVPLALLCG